MALEGGGLDRRVRVVFTADDQGVGKQNAKFLAEQQQIAKASAEHNRNLLRNLERALREEAKLVSAGKERVEIGRQITRVTRERLKAQRDLSKAVEAVAETEQARAAEEAAAIRRNAKLYATSAQQRAAAEAQAMRIEERALQVQLAAADTLAKRIAIEGKINDKIAERLLLERRVAAESAAGVDDRGRLTRASDSIGKMVTGLQNLGQSLFWLDALAGAAARVDQALNAAAETTLRNEAIARSAQVSIEGASLAMRGQISQIELQTKANEAYRLGVVKTSADLTQLALAASVLGESIGQTAEESLNSATTALARQSTALLDNLGVSLKVGDAQDLYAKQLNKQTKDLTAVERAEAFRVIGLKKLVAASKEAARSSSAAALAYREARVELINRSNEIFGFTNRVGLAREALRGLTDAERANIKTLGVYGQSANDINKALARYAEEQAAAATEILGFQVSADKFKITVKEIQDLERSEGLNLFGTALEDAKILAMQAEELRKEQEKQDRAAELQKESEELEHHVALLEAAGAEEKDTLAIQGQILGLRIERAKVLGDEVEAAKLLKELEVAQVKESTAKSKRRGGGSRVSQADRVRAGGASAVQELESAAKIAEAMATTAEEALVVEELLRDAALAKIDLERQALAVTKARTEVERQQLETKKQALDQEAELIETQRRVAARAVEKQLIKDALELSTERVRVESEVTGRVIDLEQARLRQAEQRIKAEGALASAGERSEAKREAIAEGTARRLHALRMQQIDAEAKARERLLDLREAELLARSPDGDAEELKLLDDQRQLAHDREIARIENELAVREAADAEKARLAEREAGRLAAALEQLSAWEGAFSSVQGQVMGVASQLISARQAAQDQDLQRYVSGLQSRGAAQQAALDREIEAAKDNASLRSDIERRKAKLEQNVQAEIEAAQARHNERRKRAEMRYQGIQLLIQGAVSVAKAASSYPNIPAMVAHAAAAAINFTYGGMLLAGQVPGAGGGGSLAGGGGGRDFAGRSQSQTSEAPTTPESVPAADRQPRRPSDRAPADGGGTVIVINGDINSLGTLDQQALEQLGLGIGQAAYGREGAAA